MANKTNSNESTSVRQRTHRGVDRIMDKAQSMNESGKEAYGRFKDKTMAMRENIDGTIERNPERSVLMAAGIGLIAGAIITATMMRKR